MARFALIRGGTVAAVVNQAIQPIVDFGGAWVDITGQHVGPGYTYNGSVFAPPAATVSLAPRDFWRRFLVAEREALQDMLDNGTAAQKKKLKAFMSYVQTGGNVELNDDYIIASVTLMETAGVLGAGRAAIVLG